MTSLVKAGMGPPRLRFCCCIIVVVVVFVCVFVFCVFVCCCFVVFVVVFVGFFSVFL